MSGKHQQHRRLDLRQQHGPLPVDRDQRVHLGRLLFQSPNLAGKLVYYKLLLPKFLDGVTSPRIYANYFVIVQFKYTIVVVKII